MPFEILPLETSNVSLLVALLFVAGLSETLLSTWATFAVVKRQTAIAALITFFGQLLEFAVFLAFVSNLDKWYSIVSYVIGATIGISGVIEFQKSATRRKKQRHKQRKEKAAKRKQKIAGAPKKVNLPVAIEKKLEKVVSNLNDQILVASKSNEGSSTNESK